MSNEADSAPHSPGMVEVRTIASFQQNVTVLKAQKTSAEQEHNDMVAALASANEAVEHCQESLTVATALLASTLADSEETSPDGGGGTPNP
jgi:hypothetical protein